MSKDIIGLLAELQDVVLAAAHQHFDVQLDALRVEIPTHRGHGDLALPVAFDIAKQMKLRTGEKHNPRQIAQVLVASIQSVSTIRHVAVVGAGYLDIFL